MSDNRPYRRIPSLRRALIRVHRDLLTIHDLVDASRAAYPRRLTDAERLVLVLEDRRFFSHGGFDGIALCREFFKLFTESPSGGASTIDMQLVRTATGYRERSVKRKLYEMFLASMIQLRYSKVVILRSYLSAAYFGTNLRGIEAASITLYRKYSDELDIQEASYIASLLVFPKPAEPTETWSRKVLRRSNYIKSIYVRHKKRFDKLEAREFT